MKKLVTLLLLCAMLAPSIVACSDSTPNADDTNNPGGESESVSDETAAGESAEEEETILVSDDLPDKRFDGYTYNIFTRSSTSHYQFAVEEMTADPVNDAIYERNKRLEERFGIKIVETIYSNEGDPTTLVAASDQTYALMNVRCTQANTMAQKNYCIDIDTLTYIDLDKPYWDAELTEAISFGSRSYTAIGSSNLTAIDFMNVLLFNKTVLEEANLENLYNLVDEGKWTFDKFGEIAGSVSKEVNGDGIQDASDLWGLLGNAKYTHCSLIQAAGALYIAKDEDNYPVYQINTDEHFLNVFNKIFEICNDNGAWYLTTDESNEATQYHDMFRNDQGLFLSTIFYYIESMRDMESDFGIIPYPKWDENQEHYLNRVNFFDTSVIPTSVDDVERASIILEALTCDSFNYVLPAYKDTALKGRYPRDPESSRMIDYLFEHRVLDLGDTYFCSEIRDGFIRSMFYNNDRNIVSASKSRAKVFSKTMEKMIAEYEALE